MSSGQSLLGEAAAETAVAETAVGPVSVPSQVAWVSVVYIALSSRDCEQSEIRWSRQHDYIASG